MNEHNTHQPPSTSPEEACKHLGDGPSAIREAREDDLRDKALPLGFVLHKVLSSPDATDDRYIVLDLACRNDFCIFTMTLDVVAEYIDEQDA